MLQDKDRIFTNLYGLHSPDLAAREDARQLGRHEVPARKGPRLDHRRDEEVGPARPWRRGLPDRHEMVVHAQAVGRPPELPRGQRGRIRARHLQGSRDHAARSASSRGRLPDRVLRHERERRLHLHSRRIHRRALCVAKSHRRGLRGAADRPGQHPRFPVRSLSPPRRRRLYLRRRNGASRKPRRQEGNAAPEAAIPGQYGPLRLPDDRQQRRIHRRCGHDPAPRRVVVLRASAGRTMSAPSCSACPVTWRSPATSKRRWA